MARFTIAASVICLVLGVLIARGKAACSSNPMDDIHFLPGVLHINESDTTNIICTSSMADGCTVLVDGVFTCTFTYPAALRVNLEAASNVGVELTGTYGALEVRGAENVLSLDGNFALPYIDIQKVAQIKVLAGAHVELGGCNVSCSESLAIMQAELDFGAGASPSDCAFHVGTFGSVAEGAFAVDISGGSSLKIRSHLRIESVSLGNAFRSAGTAWDCVTSDSAITIVGTSLQESRGQGSVEITDDNFKGAATEVTLSSITKTRLSASMPGAALSISDTEIYMPNTVFTMTGHAKSNASMSAEESCGVRLVGDMQLLVAKSFFIDGTGGSSAALGVGVYISNYEFEAETIHVEGHGGASQTAAGGVYAEWVAMKGGGITLNGNRGTFFEVTSMLPRGRFALAQAAGVAVINTPESQNGLEATTLTITGIGMAGVGTSDIGSGVMLMTPIQATESVVISGDGSNFAGEPPLTGQYYHEMPDQAFCFQCGVMMSLTTINNAASDVPTVRITGRSGSSRASTAAVSIISTAISASDVVVSGIELGTQFADDSESEKSGIHFQGFNLTASGSVELGASVHVSNAQHFGVWGILSTFVVAGDLTITGDTALSATFGPGRESAVILDKCNFFSSIGVVRDWTIVGRTSETDYSTKTDGVLMANCVFELGGHFIQLHLDGYARGANDVAAVTIENCRLDALALDIEAETGSSNTASGDSFVLMHVDDTNLSISTERNIRIRSRGRTEGEACRVENVWLEAGGSLDIDCTVEYPSTASVASVVRFESARVECGEDAVINGIAMNGMALTGSVVDIARTDFFMGTSFSITGSPEHDTFASTATVHGVRFVGGFVQAETLTVTGAPSGKPTDSAQLRGVGLFDLEIDGGSITISGNGGDSGISAGVMLNGVTLHGTSVHLIGASEANAGVDMYNSSAIVDTSITLEGNGLSVASDSSGLRIGKTIVTGGAALAIRAETLFANTSHAVICSNCTIDVSVVDIEVYGADSYRGLKLENSAVQSEGGRVYIGGQLHVARSNYEVKGTRDLEVEVVSLSGCAVNIVNTICSISMSMAERFRISGTTVSTSQPRDDMAPNVGVCISNVDDIGQRTHFDVDVPLLEIIGSAGIWTNEHPHSQAISLAGVAVALATVELSMFTEVVVVGSISPGDESALPPVAVLLSGVEVSGLGSVSLDGLGAGVLNASGVQVLSSDVTVLDARITGYAGASSSGVLISNSEWNCGGSGGTFTLVGSSAASLGPADTSPAVVLETSTINGFEQVSLLANGANSGADGMHIDTSPFTLPEYGVASFSAVLVDTAQIPLVFENNGMEELDIMGGAIHLGYDGSTVEIEHVKVTAAIVSTMESVVTLHCSLSHQGGAQIHERLLYLFALSWDMDEDQVFETPGAIVDAEVASDVREYSCRVEFLGEVLSEDSVQVVPTAMPQETPAPGLVLAVSAGGPYVTVTGLPVQMKNSSVEWVNGGVAEEALAVAFAWDMDGDGEFDDAIGLRPFFTKTSVEGVFWVAVEATAGEFSATDTTTVTVGPSDRSPILAPGGGEMNNTDVPPPVATVETPAPTPTPSSTPTPLSDGSYPTPRPTSTPMPEISVEVVANGPTSNIVHVMREDTGDTIASVGTQSTVVLAVTLLEPHLLPPAPFVSAVLDVNAVNGFGEVVPLEGNAEICFSTTDKERDNRCLGYLDEATSKWRCEDQCLKQKDDMLCGTANHFTNFAVLVGGGRGSSDDPCEYQYDFFTGSALWDSLVMIFAIVGVLCLMVAFIALSYIRPVRRILYGVEGSRIMKQREGQQTASGGGEDI